MKAEEAVSIRSAATVDLVIFIVVCLLALRLKGSDVCDTCLFA